MQQELRIALVNMPFASLRYPSFALSQLVSVLRERFGDQVRVDVIYANHEFARKIGVETYETIASTEEHDTGVGEWLFRNAAFPEMPSNESSYLNYYYGEPSKADFRTLLHDVSSVTPMFCKETVDAYDLGAADIVGCTSMFAQVASSLALAREVKQVAPGVLTAMGGANCEAPMGAELVAQAGMLDLAFSGPALRTFPEVISYLMEGSFEKHKTLPGVLSESNSSNPIQRNSVGSERPINNVVVPEFSSFVEAFDWTYKERGIEPILFFESSRGCWWGEKAHCTFCGLNGSLMNYRSLRSDLALEQFEYMFAYHPWCSTLFCVDNIMPTEFISDVFPKLRPPKSENILYEVKVNDLGRKELSTMAQAGVSWVQPGIEALSTHTLKLMNKGASSFQNISFLKNCVTCDVSPVWNLLIGFPGELEETYEHYLNYIPLLTHLPPPTGVGRVRFDRYSPYHTRAKEYGLSLEPFEYYRMTFPFDEESLREIAYYFQDRGNGTYREIAEKWHGRLSQLVNNWRTQWETPKERPILIAEETTDEQCRIIDTRNGKDESYFISDDCAQLLTRLTRSTRVSKLLSSGISNVRRDLAFLRARGLLFEEGDRALSLTQPAWDRPGDGAPRASEVTDERLLIPEASG